MASLSTYLNPQNPNQMIIPATLFSHNGSTISLPQGTEVFRILSDGTRESKGIKYNFHRFQFELDLDQLTPAELQSRKISLYVQNERAKARRSIELKGLEKAKNLQEKFLVEQFSQLESGLKISITERVKRGLVEDYRREYDKYCALYDLFCSLSDSLPPAPFYQRAENFLTLYQQEHTDLAPRQHKIRPLLSGRSKEEEAKLEADAQSLDREDSDSITVHGCVIAMNGGIMGTAFKLDTKERAKQEIQIKVSAFAIIQHLADYLYGRKICLENDQQAFELFELARQWEMKPLQAICRAGAIREHVKMAHPKNLVSPSQFESELSGTSEEMEKRGREAFRQIDCFLERYFKPHIDR